ncbi:tryptophan-rich sensory protein [Amycolatopsis antarctica]|uniref:Tryptophan-rich sensory protein n=1 Tax=Amycolatopsis antarctica TaxID=1854586 RepID=A0A263D8P6_9PSEU|nr:TspO/MBR family protein [Amycolatopsis antarctica]OZM74761.1 tryptophan-rich sensory protein [Amycolatopsis antarctica]
MSTATQAPGLRSRSSWLVLAGFLLAVLAVAVVGSLAATSSREIYDGFTQPAFAPPGWLFGPVWTVLYLMIAVSGWTFWRAAGSWRAGSRALTVYAVGLVLNALWTPLFFAAGLPEVALAEILLLDIAVVATIVLFRRRSTLAAALLVPYLAWVLFATALTIGIVVLN